MYVVKFSVGFKEGFAESVEPPLESKLFHFYGEFWENADNMVKWNSSA